MKLMGPPPAMVVIVWAKEDAAPPRARDKRRIKVFQGRKGREFLPISCFLDGGRLLYF
jgi:hypothetical protein